MDQKHAMLYGELQTTESQTQDRVLASTAIGLPVERHGEPPPPSYDMAISPNQPMNRPSTIVIESNLTDNWYPNTTFQPAVGNNNNPTQQHMMQTPHFARNEVTSRSFIDPNHPHYQQTTPPVHVLNQPHMPKLGPHPCTIFCPACGTSRSTKMAYTANTRTHFCALLLCLVGWCCCACFVPYCTNSCRTGNHYCTTCNTFLGTYNPQDTP